MIVVPEFHDKELTCADCGQKFINTFQNPSGVNHVGCSEDEA
jgi:hypothetical protein